CSVRGSRFLSHPRPYSSSIPPQRRRPARRKRPCSLYTAVEPPSGGLCRFVQRVVFPFYLLFGAGAKVRSQLRQPFLLQQLLQDQTVFPLCMDKSDTVTEGSVFAGMFSDRLDNHSYKD